MLTKKKLLNKCVCFPTCMLLSSLSATPIVKFHQKSNAWVLSMNVCLSHACRCKHIFTFHFTTTLYLCQYKHTKILLKVHSIGLTETWKHFFILHDSQYKISSIGMGGWIQNKCTETVLWFTGYSREVMINFSRLLVKFFVVFMIIFFRLNYQFFLFYMNNFSRLYPEPDGLEWCKKTGVSDLSGRRPIKCTISYRNCSLPVPPS